MEDLREVEERHILEVCQLLSNQYPTLLEVTNYEHPVKGARKSLLIKPYNYSADIELLRSVDINFLQKEIMIKTEYRDYKLTNIFKDEMVI